MQPIPGVSVCLIRHGRVLLAQRGKPPAEGLWSLPGGHVERDETAEQAALRELVEETGVTGELIRPLDNIEIVNRDPAGAVVSWYRLTVFAARWLCGEPTAASDARAVRWAAPDELKALPMTPGTADLIRASIRNFSDL